MFNKLFKKDSQSPSSKSFVEETHKPKPKTVQETVQEIHDTFFTEVDRLLADAKIMKSTETQKQALLDKASRLVAAGFGNTKECKEANAEIDRITALQKENESKESLRRAIEYFSQKYPLYKFITEDSVKSICNKYNLIYGTADRYIGTFPDKNLVEMEKFKVDDDDLCWEDVETAMMSMIGGQRIVHGCFSGKKLRLEKEAEEERFKDADTVERYLYEARKYMSPGISRRNVLCPREIAALNPTLIPKACN